MISGGAKALIRAHLRGCGNCCVGTLVAKIGTRGGLGLKIEKDESFKANKPLSEYAKGAREKGRIVAYRDGDLLRRLEGLVTCIARGRSMRNFIAFLAGSAFAFWFFGFTPAAHHLLASVGLA